MDRTEASKTVERLMSPEGDASVGWWRDSKEVATMNWRPDVLSSISDPLVGDGVALIELLLNYGHPMFSGIARIDGLGIWYTDGDGSVSDPAWRLSLLPWRHVDELTLHQVS